MAALDPATLDRWRALAIVDRNGTTVGTISEFYLDRETGYPTWALVDTGLFGSNQTFVPLVHATEIDDGLQVPYEKRHIKDAPRVDLHDELSPDEEATLFGHYGVEYQPSAVAGSPPGEAAGSEPGGVPDEPGSVEGPGSGGVPGEPGSVEGPGPVPAEPGSVEGPGPVPVEPGSVEAPGPVPAEPESVEGAGTMPAEPGSAEHRVSGPVAGSAEADEVTQVTPGRFGLAAEQREHPANPDPSRTIPGARDFDQSRSVWGDHDPGPSRTAPSDPELSRTAPVEPGLPGSTAASTSDPIPTTVDKDAGPDPDARLGEEPPQDEPSWPPAADSFEEPTSEERPVAASDRWREAKLAAERERIDRTAAAQPEERSPLERARRRLERLVGGGQDDDSEGISPAERDAAEQARRARLGLDEDDRRR